MPIFAGIITDGVRYEFVPTAVDEPESVTGELRLSSPLDFSIAEARAFIEVIDTDHEAGVIEIHLDAGETTKESLHLLLDGERVHIPFLFAPAYSAVREARSGDPEAAVALINAYYPDSRTEWRFRNDCSDTIQFDAYIETLDALSGLSDSFGHVQFRSGIGYFAKRIGDDVPQGIFHFQTLRDRIDRWNETENLEPVVVADVIGEKLGRESYRDGLSTERAELREIDFDPVGFDPCWETIVPACWISHLTLTDGLEAAESYVRERPVPQEEDYDGLKATAKNAGFGDRGAAWATVVGLSVRPEHDDFRYDTYNYLKWTAEEYRGKAKIGPLLWEGVNEIRPEFLPTRLVQQDECRQRVATGHVWRRDGANKRERDAFASALAIARGETDSAYEFRPELVVEAEASLVHADVKMADSHEGDLARYDEAIATIEGIAAEYDTPHWAVDNALDFLRKQRAERG